MEDILCNSIKVLRYINSPVPSNAYLLIDGSRHNCIAIDPGSKDQRAMRNFIISHGLSLDYIILTHEHFDHCWGVNSLLEACPTKVVSTRKCAEWVKKPMNYFNKLYFDSDEMYFIEKVDVYAEEIGWKLYWNDVIINFLDTKGHTDKGMCVEVGDCLFTGDTLLYKTKPFLKKKYGASKEDLLNSIERIFLKSPANTKVYPGHGEPFFLKETKSFYEDYFLKKL